MRFILQVINQDRDEIHIDKEFPSMDALKDWIRAAGFQWTSLVVTVLPARA